MTPFVFLSHSGADTEAARELKRRLLASPDAKASGLKVWFDKDDLRAGEQWQPQIEQAIARDATAFVVYVGSRGVINWVDIEVRTALSRTATDKGFPFIPILAPDVGASALPNFARLYQGVADPLGGGDGLERLLKAVLNKDWDSAPIVIDEPFVGLRSMREEEADRFFGRDAEIAELVEKLLKHRIVAVVADSGAGKSSLAAAGLAQKFRGGALADLSRTEPDERVWHVVMMRPGANPEEGLKTGVSEAAEKLGRSGDERASLRRRIALGDVSETAYALQCDLSPTKTATLLIVDQFEELLTQTPEALQAPFVRLLRALAEGDKDIRILLTTRADYFNLVSAIPDADGEPAKGSPTLYGRLTADGGDAILRLKRMSDAGLADAIVKPLRRAGDRDEAAEDALVRAVRRDISDQPSDLPLMQVALRAAWREHRARGIGLLEAYHTVGGVLGALANEANAAVEKLSPEDQARLKSIFVRLVRARLGLGGRRLETTRRLAGLDEFEQPKRELLQKLASAKFGWLIALSETTVEIAHEALITQWPWLENELKLDELGMDRLDRLISKSRDWREAPDKTKNEYIATGAEKDSFQKLALDHPDWLSNSEKEFIAASNEAHRIVSYAPVAKLLQLAWNDYRGWAKRARELQANAQRFDRPALILLVAAAACGAASTMFSFEIGVWLALTASFAASVGSFMSRGLINVGREAEWVQARTTAEAIKSQCFRYAAGTYAGTDSEAANEFDLRLAQLRHSASEKGLVPADDPISEFGDKRAPVLPLTKDWYKANRCNDQILYYRAALFRNQASAKSLWWLAFASGLFAVSFAAAGTFALRFTPWVGVMTTVVASGIAGFASLNRSQTDYRRMQASLQRLMSEDELKPMRLSELVRRVEDLLQNEDIA